MSDFLAVDPTFVIEDKKKVGVCSFYVVNDNIPEGNKTYPVNLTVIIGGGEVQPNVLTFITILPNDDPYGCIAFSKPAEVITVNEPDGGTNVYVTFNITRHGGRIGDVAVLWKVSCL